MYEQMAAVTCQVGLEPRQGFKELSSILSPHSLFTLCLSPLSNHKLGVVATDGSGCWMLPSSTVLPKPLLIKLGPRLHVPLHSEHRRGEGVHLPFPSHLLSLTLRSCHREGELSVPAETLLSSRSTPKPGHQPTSLLPRMSLYSSHMEVQLG